MKRLSWLLLPLAFAACDREEPVGIGSGLLPEDPLRTFVVTLEPAQFLLLDTAFSVYGAIERPGFNILARDFEGALNAHTLARFTIPELITIVDSAGITRADTLPIYVGGEILFVVDTAASEWPAALRVGAYRVAEAWDPDSATWLRRTATEAWSVPGGTPGADIDVTPFVPGDTVRLVVDSATIAAWRDTTDASRGALLRLLDAPSRLRTLEPRLRAFARSTWHPDTLFTVNTPGAQTRFVYDPRPDSVASDIRFNGSPSWRSFLHFRDDIGDITVSCGPGCTAPLRDLDITRAALVLEPVDPPAGFMPEVASGPVAYSAFVVPQIPLERTPLGPAEVGATPLPLTLADFGAGADSVQLVVTPFLRQLISDTTSDYSTGRSEWLAIVGDPPQTFGFGRFAPGPRLRLVLSTARGIQP